MTVYKFFNDLPEQVQGEVLRLLHTDRLVTNPSAAFNAGYGAGIEWIKAGELSRMRISSCDMLTRTFELPQGLREDDFDIMPTENVAHELCNEVKAAYGFHKGSALATSDDIEFEKGFIHAVDWAFFHVEDRI